MPPENNAREALEAATRAHQAGHFAEAERIYRDLLLREPHNVGLLNALGIALAQLGRLEEAVAAYRRALSHDERFADAYNNLGIALRSLRRAAEAEQSFRDAIGHKGDFPEAHNNLAVVLTDQGRAQEAVSACSAALAIRPRYPAALTNLGNALRLLGRLDEAERSYRQAILLEPRLAEAHSQLGLTLADLGRLDESLRACEAALIVDPNLAQAHNNLGMTLRAVGKLADAERSYRKALTLEPGSVAMESNLGAVLADAGKLGEGERHYRRALELKPDSAVTFSNLLFVLNHDPLRNAEAIFAEHCAFGSRFQPSAPFQPHRNQAQPERRLRIGYCSGDFRRHAVASFFEPVLSKHDHERYEIYCYHNNPGSDGVTLRFKGYSDHWREIHGLEDKAFCDLVRQDAIDILVDLSGHTARNRLPAFAQKPAPVQATWLGYINTTGLRAMDYRLTDAHVSPPSMLDALSTERLLRLPDSQWCYQPSAEAEVAPLPYAASGIITFGAFTNPMKINRAVAALWGEVLARVPNSRLLVQLRVPASIPAEYGHSLLEFGVPRERLAMVGALPLERYLDLHGQVDVMLDTFPVTGGTTTCDSLWMGVPVVSFAGNTMYSRGGASLLHAVGLGELVAYTREQYVELAATLAADPKRLAALRQGLRQRMRESPLMDAQRFTRNLEDAYRGMWRAWCEGR